MAVSTAIRVIEKTAERMLACICDSPLQTSAASTEVRMSIGIAVYNPLDRGPKVGERLSAHAIAAIVKRRASRAVLPGDFAGHSLRRGFVTEAGLNDIPLAQTMAMTGHRLTKSVVRYSEVGDVLSSKASDLLKLGRKKK